MSLDQTAAWIRGLHELNRRLNYLQAQLRKQGCAPEWALRWYDEISLEDCGDNIKLTWTTWDGAGDSEQEMCLLHANELAHITEEELVAWEEAERETARLWEQREQERQAREAEVAAEREKKRLAAERKEELALLNKLLAKYPRGSLR